MKKIVCLFLSIFILFGVVSPVCLAQEEDTKASDVGIDLSCLTGMCKGAFDYEKAIGIDDEQNPNITATTIVQDIIFAVTYMVGTVLTIVIIYCGLMYIFASRGGKNPDEYRKGLVNAAIGAILVRGAYAIVRLIQYVAKG